MSKRDRNELLARQAVRYLKPQNQTQDAASREVSNPNKNEIMVVVTPEVGPIKNTSVFLDIAGQLGLSLDKIHIILNRADSSVGINVQEIERSFKHRIEFSIVSGGRPVVLSVNHGQPLTLVKSDHPVSKEIFRIADWLIKNTPKS